MKYDLAQMARAAGLKRKRVVLPSIAGTKAQQDELARLYMRVVKSWEQSLPEIMAAYSATIAAPQDGMTRDALSDISRAIDVAEMTATRIIITLTPTLRDWATRIERYTRGKFASGVLSATGVNLDTVIGPADARDTLDAWTARNVSLVRDVSNQARQRISEAVFRGFNRRLPARDVAKSLREAAGMSRTRALRISQDQLSKLTSQLADERRRQAGIEEWEWQHSGKVNGREEHEAIDGDTFSDKNPPEDMPGELPFCGCRQRPLLNLDN